MDQIINDILCNVKEYLKGLTGDDKFYASANHKHTKNQITDFTHGNESHSEEYAKKDYVDEHFTQIGENQQDAINRITELRTDLNKKVNTDTFNSTKTDLQNQINNKSIVSYTATQTNGNEIGKLKINNDTKTLYSTDLASKIKDSKAHENIGSSENATQATINNKIDSKILSLKHPTTHSTNIITDPNAHNNIGSDAGATQSTINNKIDSKILSLKHPDTHSTNMIKDSNAYSNIGTTANATQTSINTKINENLKLATISNPGIMAAEYVIALNDVIYDVDDIKNIKTHNIHSKIKLWKYGQIVMIVFDHWEFNMAKDYNEHSLNDVVIPEAYKPPTQMYMVDANGEGYIVANPDGSVHGCSRIAAPNEKVYFQCNCTWITNK